MRADDAAGAHGSLGAGYDLAGVLIGLCRARGIAARYVSGYLLDPGGNGDRSATHAWVDVLDPERGVGLARPDPRHRADRPLHPRRGRSAVYG